MPIAGCRRPVRPSETADANQPVVKVIQECPKIIRTGLGEEVDVIACKSLTLQSDLERLDDEDWDFIYGEWGKGSSTNRGGTLIVIDPVRKGDPVSVTQALAHEVGHARYRPKGLVSPFRRTREDYIRSSLRSLMNDEGEATLYNMEVRSEILRNRGPDIGVGSKYAKQCEAIAARYPNPGDRDLARDLIGGLLKDGHPSIAPNKTYERLYSEYYSEKWDTFQKLLRYRESGTRGR